MVVTHRYAACFTCGKMSSKNNTLNNAYNGQLTNAANAAVNKLLTGNNLYNQPWRPDGQLKNAKSKCFRLQIDIRSTDDESKEVRIQTAEHFTREIESCSKDKHTKRNNEFAEFQQRTTRQKITQQTKHSKLRALREHKDTPAAKVPRALPMPIHNSSASSSGAQ